MLNLDNLNTTIRTRLINEEYVRVSVHVFPEKDFNGNTFVDRKYILDRVVYSEGEKARYERDDDISKDGLTNDAVSNLKSCFNPLHYDFKVDRNAVEISPREGVSIAERIISGD